MEQKLKLGLVCISNILQETENVRSRTMTRKGFLKESDESISISKLSERILNNTLVVKKTIEHCHDLGISHYRIGDSCFPLVTDPKLGLSLDLLPDIKEIRKNLFQAGEYARKHGISLSSHPSQYNVLGSYNPDVVTNTIRELNHISNVLDMMGCPQSYATPICLHLSVGVKIDTETEEEYRDRFMKNLSQCDLGVQHRLVLENEDKGYWSCKKLYRLFNKYIPLVYDNLHDACNPSPDNCDWVTLFKETWRHYTPVFHWSEGIDGSNRHTDYFSHIPDVVRDNPDVIWECEVKAKDRAIQQILNYEKEKQSIKKDQTSTANLSVVR